MTDHCGYPTEETSMSTMWENIVKMLQITEDESVSLVAEAALIISRK